MITVISFLFILTATHCFAVENNRRYEPKEEDPYRIQQIVWQDENNQYHYENLLEHPDASSVAGVSDVTYYLYTKNNFEDPDVIPGDGISYLPSSNYRQNRTNVFVIHGWNNDHQSAINRNLRIAILNKYDVNLFIVDWSPITNQFYTTAFRAVPSIGEIVGNFIYSIMITHDQSSSKFYLIGHSLGAHVCGCAGALISKLTSSQVNSIVGLDPAGPLFTINNIRNRLDFTDADFVHVIHTNGGGLGFESAIGHADYYPNGGSVQAGCGFDPVGNCAHTRAHLYYAESITSSGFLSYKCDSLPSFNNGTCSNNEQSYMGELFFDKLAAGDYYLNTNSDEPFALG